MNIERAKKVYESSRGMKFSQFKALDDIARMSLLTVAAGIRPLAYFPEDEALQTQAIRNVCTGNGLYSERSNRISVLSQIGDEPKAMRLVPFTGPKKQLWVFSSDTRRQEFQDEYPTHEELGRLLSFPQCCAKAYETVLLEDEDELATKATFAAFPLILHVACSDCLTDSESPSALIQQEFITLLNQIDPAFLSSASTTRFEFASA